MMAAGACFLAWVVAGLAVVEERIRAWDGECPVRQTAGHRASSHASASLPGFCQSGRRIDRNGHAFRGKIVAPTCQRETVVLTCLARPLKDPAVGCVEGSTLGAGGVFPATSPIYFSGAVQWGATDSMIILGVRRPIPNGRFCGTLGSVSGAFGDSLAPRGGLLSRGAFYTDFSLRPTLSSGCAPSWQVSDPLSGLLVEG
jgi:hypothetical protein